MSNPDPQDRRAPIEHQLREPRRERGLPEHPLASRALTCRCDTSMIAVDEADHEHLFASMM